MMRVWKDLLVLLNLWRNKMVEIQKQKDNKVDIIILKNEELEVWVTNYGCTILRIIYNGVNCVLGFQDISDYDKRDGSYLGALVGRVCNRIEKGTFTLNGKEYHLPINNGPNSLHGGLEGFSYKVFDYECFKDSVKFHYVSKDGEEGYPGTLDFYAIYSLDGSSLHIQYEATSDEDTIINITNHSYFNLDGKPSYIGNHSLQVAADTFGCVDCDGLFTGEIQSVDNSAFDYRHMHRVDDSLSSLDEQIAVAKGLDHSFIFNKDLNQVTLYSPETKIELCVSTSLPCAQLYSANYLNEQMDIQGNRMNAQSALCIETQFMPDSIHKEENPKVILKKGDCFKEETIYMFKVKS